MSLTKSKKTKAPTKKKALPLLSVAHSPDPDDAFMFYGISQGGLNLPFRIRHVLKDIQSLNRDALKGKYHITAISAAAYPSVADKYWILSVGSSIGRNYGPIIVTEPKKASLLKKKSWEGLRIAVPGTHTTAFLMIQLYRQGFKPVQMPFDKIIPAVKSGRVDGGLVIHEGQITYPKFGLTKIVDLGKWWYRQTKLPIPLGLDVIRKDMGRKHAVDMANILYESISFAYDNIKDAVKYSLKFGRGINAKVGERFVKMYVNNDTLDMGKEGEKSLSLLFEKARQQKLLPRKVKLHIIRPTIKKRKV